MWVHLVFVGGVEGDLAHFLVPLAVLCHAAHRQLHALEQRRLRGVAIAFSGTRAAGQIDRQTDRQTGGYTRSQKGVQTDRQIDGRTDGWMGGREGGRTDGRTDRQTDGSIAS